MLIAPKYLMFVENEYELGLAVTDCACTRSVKVQSVSRNNSFDVDCACTRNGNQNNRKNNKSKKTKIKV